MKLVKTSTKCTAFYIFIYEGEESTRLDNMEMWDGFWVFTDAISKFSFNPECKSAHKAKYKTTFTSKITS